MTKSDSCLRAAMIRFPLLVVIAVPAVGCEAPLGIEAPPQVLATGLTTPFGIAVDSTSIYVSQIDSSPLLAIPVGGGEPSPVGVQAKGAALAVDEQRLYWSDGSSLLACDKSNCTETVVILAPVQSYVLNIALDATNVYWTEGGPGRVMKIDKNAGVPVDGGSPPDGGSSIDGSTPSNGGGIEIATARWPYRVAVDATNVYWIEQMQPNAGVFEAPIAGGPTVQLATDPVEPMGIALDEGNVYFADSVGMAFMVSKSGGPTRVLLSNLGEFPSGIATDETTLYVAASTKLLSMPLGGGPARTLIPVLAGAASIAVDATSVYVADDDGGAVVRALK